MIDIDFVVWDFDGVINRNIFDGRCVWADNMENDLGIDSNSFTKYVFGDKFKDIINGRISLLSHIDSWIEYSDCNHSSQAIIDYWFEKDAMPDPNILHILHEVESHGVKNVIATNNETMRAEYIENNMGFSQKVETVFASGRMKCIKPSKDFFNQVSEILNVPTNRLLLIDDTWKNVRSAASLGWHTHHFEEAAYTQLRETLNIPARMKD